MMMLAGIAPARAKSVENRALDMVTETEWLDAKSAAAYLSLSKPGFFSLSKPGFFRRVQTGVVLAPSFGLGERSPRWKRADLDAMMRPDTSSDFNATVAKIVACIKAGKQKRGARTQ
jgi:predicted DNA-binding transcriptional regulator AlpA